jgi:cytochrome c553
MRIAVALTACALAIALSSPVGSQQDAAESARADRAWAFPMKPERSLPDDGTIKTLPGSARTYTQDQIDDLLNPPDWFPDRRPPAPQIVFNGHGNVLACAACHLTSGLGHPESADLTGLSATYIVRQMDDFRSGARKDPTRMNTIARETSSEEAMQAAQWFALLPRRAFTQVVEAGVVPKTFLGPGRMRFAELDGAVEPVGQRIITVPEDPMRARLRDPDSGFVAYVPPGSLAHGRDLVETGAGKTTPCGSCHGDAMQGLGDVPRLAGQHPIYTVRQLHWFRDGTRNGPDAQSMKAIVGALTDADILAISAYLGSLPP